MKRAILILIAALALGACTMPVLPPPPSGGGHIVWGDSLSWQATNYGPGEVRNVQGRQWNVFPGMALKDLHQRILDSIATNPHTITFALGTNDAGTWDGKDGWNYYDEWAWDNVLRAAKDRGVRVVVVLPWVQVGTVATATDVANVELARCWLSSQPGISVVDWREYVATGVLDAGGIHVSAGMEGVRYQATVAGDPL